MGLTPRGYKTADTGGADASRKRKDTFDEQFGSGTDSNIMKIDEDITNLENDITNLESDIDSLPKTFLLETEPTSWKAGDWWFQIVRERTSGIEQISTTLQTSPYDSTMDYHLKTDKTIETVENLDNGDLIVKI